MGKVFYFLFVVSLVARLDARLKFTSGSIDRSFGGNGLGFRLLSLGGGNDNAQAIVLDKLGRIVCAGIGGGTSLAIARFTPEGLTDLSFGGNGTGFRLFDLGGNDFARGIALDSKGRIICAGRGVNDFLVVRFTPDGLLDPSFGETGPGFTLLNLGGIDFVQAMALDSQERIICVGAGGNELAVARFTPDGLVDPSFGETGPGFTLLNLGGISRALTMLLDSQERIVCGGRGSNDFAIVRFSSNGILDLTFGGNETGFRLLDLGGDDRIESIAFDSQGRIVCAGRGGAGGDVAIARFTSEGLVDPSFGGNETGFRLLDVGGTDDRAEAMSLDSQGRIVCAGQGADNDFLLVRFTPDGLLDFTFGVNGTGFSLFDLGGGNDRARAMTLDSQGRIVGAGQGGIGNDLSVVRVFGEFFQECTLVLRKKYCSVIQ